MAEPQEHTPLQVTTARIAVAIRSGTVIIGGPMALLAAVPPVNTGLLVVAIAVYAAWVVIFVRVALTRGLTPHMVAADAAVTIGYCLLNPVLVPLHRVGEGSGWVAQIASMCLVTMPLAWRARASLPVGAVVIAAFAASFHLAGIPGVAWRHTPTMVLQLISSAVVMVLVRRASSAAETALAAAHETRRSAAIAAGRRADEDSQLRLLHDTALTTLTLIGTGAITRSDTLARRAGADLALVERLYEAAAETTSTEGRERLDVQLLAVAREPPAAVTVRPVLDECAVPAFVVAAFVGSVGEALRNVERHAGVRDVDLRLTADGGRITVEVADRGRGFDPEARLAHRHGIRESIVGRMAAVGGAATLTADPARGTRWTLEWAPPADRDPSAIVGVSANRYARGTALAAITVAGSWHLVNDLTMMVLGWSAYEEPAVAAVAWLIVAAVTAAGALNLLRGTGKDHTPQRVLGITLLLVCSVGLTVATRDPTDVVDGGIFTSHNWAWAAFGWFALVLLWRSPLSAMLAVIAANWALVFIAILLTGPVDRILVSRYVMVVLGSSAIQLSVAVGARSLVRAASRAARASAERADVLTARQTADEVHSDRQRRYRELGPAVRQLLAGLSGGRPRSGRRAGAASMLGRGVAPKTAHRRAR